MPAENSLDALLSSIESNTCTELHSKTLNSIAVLNLPRILYKLKHNTSVTTVDLSRIPIDSAGRELIITILKNSKNIQHLDLQNTGMDDENAANLANALENNKSLLSLNLADNGITTIGAKKLAKSLEQNRSLRKLNLINNQINAKGITALTNALESNKTLSILASNPSGFAQLEINSLLQQDKKSKQDAPNSDNENSDTSLSENESTDRSHEPNQDLSASNSNNGKNKGRAFATDSPVFAKSEAINPKSNKPGDELGGKNTSFKKTEPCCRCIII